MALQGACKASDLFLEEIPPHPEVTMKPIISQALYPNARKAALFTACLPLNGPSRIVVQPVKDYYPGSESARASN